MQRFRQRLLGVGISDAFLTNAGRFASAEQFALARLCLCAGDCRLAIALRLQNGGLLRALSCDDGGLALSVGLLEDRRFQLALFALDFHLLNRDGRLGASQLDLLLGDDDFALRLCFGARAGL